MGKISLIHFLFTEGWDLLCNDIGSSKAGNNSPLSMSVRKNNIGSIYFLDIICKIK